METKAANRLKSVLASIKEQADTNKTWSVIIKFSSTHRSGQTTFNGIKAPDKNRAGDSAKMKARKKYGRHGMTYTVFRVTQTDKDAGGSSDGKGSSNGEQDRDDNGQFASTKEQAVTDINGAVNFVSKTFKNNGIKCSVSIRSVDNQMIEVKGTQFEHKWSIGIYLTDGKVELDMYSMPIVEFALWAADMVPDAKYIYPERFKIGALQKAQDKIEKGFVQATTRGDQVVDWLTKVNTALTDIAMSIEK